MAKMKVKKNNKKQRSLDPDKRGGARLVSSVLSPFYTKPLRLPFDYPLNTSVVEYTSELNYTATAGSSNYPIPLLSSGLAIAIFPHAF
jgi:hypothetical protein